MKQYDGFAGNSTPEGKLYSVAIEVFRSVDRKNRDLVLVDALKSSDRNAQHFALRILNRTSFEVASVVPVLRELIENEETDRLVRYNAIGALSVNLTSKEAKQTLIDTVDDDDPMIVRGVVQSMVPIDVSRGGRGGRSPGSRFDAVIRDSSLYMPYLMDVVAHSDTHVRQAAYQALGRLGRHSKPAVPVLAKALQEDKDNDELVEIVTTLRKIGTVAEDAAPALIELWQKNQRPLDEQESLRQRISSAIGDISPESLRELRPGDVGTSE